jgi:hypothetical protein
MPMTAVLRMRGGSTIATDFGGVILALSSTGGADAQPNRLQAKAIDTAYR